MSLLPDEHSAIVLDIVEVSTFVFVVEKAVLKFRVVFPAGALPPCSIHPSLHLRYQLVPDFQVSVM